MNISFSTISSLFDENLLTLVTCDSCGAVITRDDMQLHDDFHTRVEP